jgi:hypothetical protein
MNIYVYIDLRNNNSEAEMNIYVYIDHLMFVSFIPCKQGTVLAASW